MPTQLAKPFLNLRTQVDDVLLERAVDVRSFARGDLLRGLLDLRRFRGDPLVAVAAAGSFELMCEISEPVDGLAALFIVERRLDLADLVGRLREKLAPQFVQLRINDRHFV